MGKKTKRTAKRPPVQSAIAQDIHADIDRGETVSAMEPLVLDSGYPLRDKLNDLALDLATRSEGFKRSLPDGVRSSLAELVCSMNCYYSNLIEGHYSHPIDIERALREDFSARKEVRNLQLEAKAHIIVQKWIDDGGVRGRATTVATIREIHRRFCELLPDELLWTSDEDSGRRERVVPGEFRKIDVKVGQHFAISPGAVARFLNRFEERYSKLGRIETIIAAAASHHRLLWIHPFADGNGRVARLVSHASLLDALDTGSLWSVARGLARSATTYKALLANADQSRLSDLDGRGALSERALGEFTDYFLGVCIDQVSFMEELVQPRRLRSRILNWAAEDVLAGVLPQHSELVLDAVLLRGELDRGDVAAILGVSPRHARRVVSALIAAGAIASEAPRSPLRLSFPAALAHRWMPGLFPEAAN